jgi:hypothetical protein
VRVVIALALVSGCGLTQRLPPITDDAQPPSDVIGMEVIPVDGPRTDWWDSTYHTRHLVTIDTSKLMGAVQGFPVLVRLTNTNVSYAKIRANAASLRFVDDDHQTVIPHEVDTFVNNGASFVWLRLDLDPAASPRLIYMYYDNPDVVSSSNPAGVFGTFVSVHHMGSPPIADASGKNHTADSPPNANPGATTQNIGVASDFDGNNDYLELPTEADFDFTNAMTVSAWIRIDQFDVDFQAIVTKGDNAWRVQRNATTRFGQYGTGDGINLDGDVIIDNNAWHHIAIAYEGTTKRLFVDGAQDAMANAGNIATTNAPVRIGMNQEAQDLGRPGGPRHWDGLLDEIRISNIARPTAWIHAEHLTVTDGTFVAIGAAEPY